jgi:hypothetical protein
MASQPDTGAVADGQPGDGLPGPGRTDAAPGTTPRSGPDPAKVRSRIRAELAELAITEHVAAELASLADDKWREVHTAEARIRSWFTFIGVPSDALPGSREAAAKLLDEMEAAHG